jgi:hypothetical protein
MKLGGYSGFHDPCDTAADREECNRCVDSWAEETVRKNECDRVRWNLKFLQAARAASRSGARQGEYTLSEMGAWACERSYAKDEVESSVRAKLAGALAGQAIPSDVADAGPARSRTHAKRSTKEIEKLFDLDRGIEMGEFTLCLLDRSHLKRYGVARPHRDYCELSREIAPLEKLLSSTCADGNWLLGDVAAYPLQGRVPKDAPPGSKVQLGGRLYGIDGCYALPRNASLLSVGRRGVARLRVDLSHDMKESWFGQCAPGQVYFQAYLPLESAELRRLEVEFVDDEIDRRETLVTTDIQDRFCQ